jgi:hypothetical protein
MRAVNYAQSLDADDIGAVFFATQPEESQALKSAWLPAAISVPLEVLEAPYRDIGDPVVRYVRELTTDPDVAVNVVMPELVLHGWRRILHNQAPSTSSDSSSSSPASSSPAFRTSSSVAQLGTAHAANAGTASERPP